MAPITVIETITITRPLKVSHWFRFLKLHYSLKFLNMYVYIFIIQVIAFLCGALALALLVMSLASTDWLLAHGWRQGLFLHCVDEMAERPLPFGLEEKVGCYRVRDECTKCFSMRLPLLALHSLLFFYADYIQFTAALCILALATDVFATLLTGKKGSRAATLALIIKFFFLKTGLGLQSGDPLKKRKYYRLAISVMLASRKTFTLDYLFLTVEVDPVIE